jgi:hypothetical protein
MTTTDNGTRYLIHKVGTRRINLRGTEMRMTAPAPLWWSSSRAEWVAQGYDVLTGMERDQITLPDNGEWVQILVEIPGEHLTSSRLA